MKHGMVSFPLTNIHPWSFRSASASWCVALQNAGSLVSFKELFYSMQSEMEVSLVTPTSLDFVDGAGLDGTAFTACYLREPSLDAVHRQMALGHQLGVSATPTYFVNGWKIQAPNESVRRAIMPMTLPSGDNRRASTMDRPEDSARLMSHG